MASDPSAIIRRAFKLKIFGFGLVSLIGLMGDYVLFTVLIVAGMAAIGANLISATAAVLFVFIVSTRHIFANTGGHLVVKLTAYLLFQLAAITLFSALIDYLSEASGLFPLIVKIATTPFSFYLNFLFMGWLTERRFHLY